MAVIGSDGLSLLVGDGASSEAFNILRGASITQLNLTQKPRLSPAIASDAWQTQAGVTDRHIVIECEIYATDEAPALRLKSLAFSGSAGNFKLQLRSTETLVLSGLVTQYEEILAAGKVKKLTCRLESSGAASLA